MAEKRLEAFVRYLLLSENVGGNTRVSVGVSEGSRLTKMLGEEAFMNSDLVVMGTKGAGTALRQLRGSNTYDVVKDSPKPVLVVPAKAKFRPLRHILFCADFDPIEMMENLNPLKTLALRFDAEVRIAHVKISRGKPSFERRYESRRQAAFFGEEVRHAFKIIRHRTVSEGLQYYIDLKKDNDLIVMVKREHGFLEDLFMKNHTRKMVFHSDLPLLVVSGRVY